MSRFALTCAVVLGLAMHAGLAGGCGSSPRVAADPMGDVRNPRLSEGRRLEAIDAAWEQVLLGGADRGAVRQELKTLAWSTSWPTSLRLRALRHLLDDPDGAGAQDSRQMARLMIPREQRPEVIRILSEAGAARGWTEMIPALVRSLSRYDPTTPDGERPEYLAIARLRPQQPVERTVLEVFINPPPEEGGYGLSTVERTRSDAWDVLARLDPAATLRMSVVFDEALQDPDVISLRRAWNDLRALPRTGEELKWVRSLRDPGKPANGTWWAEAAEAIAGVGTERAPKLHLRHAEVIRWASRHRPAWARASREELLGELQGRLAGRETHRRTAKETLGTRSRPESLEEWQNQLPWADVLTVLVIDEALRDPAIVEALFAQAAMDQADSSAEYGGVLEAMPARSGLGESAMRVVLYPPRPGTRRGDREFIAPADMIQQSDRGIAHYHFHVQSARNAEYAGPSEADLRYADHLGRHCLVLTSVGEDVLDVDYYQPGGATIDLGAIRRATPPGLR